MSRRRLVLRRALAAGLLFGGFAGVATAQEPDPFYTAMLRDGSQELARGDAERALEDLRIACFGLLEQPPLLGECLVRVGLAQAALGEREEFVTTFRRLEEVEERFSGYGAAALSGAERTEFERRAVEWVAPQILKGIPRFAELIERQQEAELAALPESKRLRELERRAAEAPGEPRWRLALAELELDRKHPAEALERLKGLPQAAGGDGAAACLSARALAGLERCADAAAAFAACPQRGREAALLEAELGCLVELGRRDDARALLAAAPPALGQRPAVAKLAAKLAAPAPEAKAPAKAAAKPAKKPEPTAAPRPTPTPAAPRAEAKKAKPPAGAPAAKAGAAPPPVSTPVPIAAATPAPPPAPPELDAESAARIQEARAKMRAARRPADLERALALAQPIAAANPQRSELHYLVGEIAYRGSRWTECAAAYLRGGAAGPEDSTQRFYMAVCLFESGDRASAAAVAATGLDKLPRSPFVDGYLRRIAGGAP